MGKVGSSTIYASLKKEKPNSDVFHIHFLSKNWLDNILPKEHKSFHINIRKGKNLREYINNNPIKRLKIITLVREPVIRGISDFFENWETRYDNIDKLSLDELTSVLEEEDYNYVLNWFNSEFNNYLKIDFYKYKFNKERGYSIYKFKNFDILCIKLEKLNTVSKSALKKYIKKDIELIYTNSSEKKTGNQLYKDIKSNYKIPRDKLLELYDSKYMKHFYTDEEINTFVKKWSK